MGDGHGPNKLSNYLETHETVMRQFISRGFILADGLALSPFGNDVFLLAGTIECAGDIVLDVSKQLKVTDDDGDSVRVENVAYSYHARIRGRGNILRYDSPHEHRQCHHVHRFDGFDADAIETIDEIPGRGWPTLGDVLYELEAWYYANFDALGRLPS